MAYTPLGLKDGEKVHASHVTHVEDGIADCESQITEVKDSLTEIVDFSDYVIAEEGNVDESSFDVISAICVGGWCYLLIIILPNSAGAAVRFTIRSPYRPAVSARGYLSPGTADYSTTGKEDVDKFVSAWINSDGGDGHILLTANLGQAERFVFIYPVKK